MTFSATLHPYQEEDVEYLLERRKMMLAYGQGTGKTVMTIAALEMGMDREIILEPGLIVCLSSLKDQWAQAIHRWTGGYQEKDKRTGLLKWVGGTSTPLVIGGTPQQRERQYEISRKWRQPGGPDYIIVSYEQVVRDWEKIRKLPRGFVVLDESTYIKGFSSKRSRRIKKLDDAPIKIALTGTPIENGKPEEVFSQMQFVDDTVLGDWRTFDKTFIDRDGWGKVRRYRNIPLFIESMAPVFRRRTRFDPEVAPFFPEVDDAAPPMVATLDRASARLYQIIATELAADLREALTTMGTFELGSVYGFGNDDGNGLTGRIAQKRMALQMLVDHPELLRASADRFERSMAGANAGGSAYIAELVSMGYLDKVKATPKMDLATQWVSDVLEADPRNKVVVFATYVDTLKFFKERLGDQAVEFTGQLSERQKAHAMATFKQDPDCRVFLSSDAGGYGIDLPEANYLLNYSFPEKWGTSDQRETRIIRASSEWDEVYVRRIVVAGSIDVMKYNRLVMKGKVSAAFLEGRGVDKKGGLANDAAGLLSFITQEAGELCVA